MANVITNLLAHEPFFSVFPSAARTASPDTQEFRMDRRGGFQPVGLILTIDVTAVTATPAVTVTINRVDPVSGKVAALLASTAIATAVTTVLRIDPNTATAANASLKDYIPPCFRIDSVHGDADSATYSVSGMLI